MKPIKFEEVNTMIAENQEEFETLPAYSNPKAGTLTYCFELDPEELKKVKETGVVWIRQLCQGQPMQAIFVTADKEAAIGEVVGWMPFDARCPKCGDTVNVLTASKVKNEVSRGDVAQCGECLVVGIVDHKMKPNTDHMTVVVDWQYQPKIQTPKLVL